MVDTYSGEKAQEESQSVIPFPPAIILKLKLVTQRLDLLGLESRTREGI